MSTSRRRAGTVLLAVAILCGAAASGWAQDTRWIGGNADWNLPGSWDNGVPAAGYNAWLDQPDLSGPGYTAIYIDPGTNPTLSTLWIDQGMTLAHDQDSLTTNTEYVGHSPTGAGGFVFQTGGIHTVNDYFVVGASDGSLGAYDLDGDAEFIKGPGEEKIGDGGLGFFYHHSGTHTFAGAMYLGDDASGEGYYEMTSGTLQAAPGQFAGIALGEWGGRGYFDQEGGDVLVNSLSLARQNDPSPSEGTYTLTHDAYLETDETLIGLRGVGTFIHDGTAEHVTDSLILGTEAPGEGTYHLGGSGVLTVNNDEWVGKVGYGTFNQSDSSSHTVHGNLYIDPIIVSKGVFNLFGGSLQVDHMTYIGNGDSAPGEFNQDGGTATIDQGLILGVVEFGIGYCNMTDGTLDTGWTHVGSSGLGTVQHTGGTHTTGTLVLAAAPTGDGTYWLSDPAVLNVTGNTVVGDAGRGELNNDSANPHTVGGDLIVGNAAGSDGLYNLWDPAAVQVSGNTIVGQAGKGIFYHNSGTHTAGGLYIGGSPGGYEPTGDGTYHLADGTLTTGITTVGEDGTGVFYHFGNAVHQTTGLVLGSAGSSTGNSSGTYSLADSGELYVNGTTTVGQFGYGAFNQFDGLHSITADLVLGAGPEQPGILPERQGLYNLDAGDLIVQRHVVVGQGNAGYPGQPGGKGTFIQTGGTHDIAAELLIGGPGAIAGGTGVYDMSGGMLSVAGGIHVACGGVGELLLSSGAHVVSSWAEIGVGAGSDATVIFFNDGTPGVNTVWNAGANLAIGGSMTDAGGAAVVGMTGAENHLRIVDAAGTSGLLRIWADGVLSMPNGNGRVSVGTDVLSAPGQLWVAPGGTLDLQGGQVWADVVEVQGLLQGSGILGADEVIIGGTADAGHSPGTLTLAENALLTLQPSAICQMDIEGIGPGQYDMFTAAGTSTVYFDGTLVLRFSGGFTPGDHVTLFDFAAYDGDFAGLIVQGLPAGLDASFDTLTGDVTITPEPATLALLSLSALFGLKRRRPR